MRSHTAEKALKTELKKKFGKTENDSGCPEVQVAILTHRIESLNGHFKTFKKDTQAQLGLLKLVGQRRRLLKYLRDKSQPRYNKLIEALELRK